MINEQENKCIKKPWHTAKVACTRNGLIKHVFTATPIMSRNDF